MNARLPETSSIPERIAHLRGAMAREGLAAYLVPSADPHLSEYLPGRWQGRQWLSGFTGSAGTLVVTDGFAGVWTDSRYWEQAEAQLAGTGVQLMKMMAGQQSQPHFEWLAQNVAAGGTVGVDGAVLGVAAARALTQALSAHGVKLRTDVDLFDAIWPQRPSLPTEAVFEHAAPHASVARSEKLAQIRRAMQEKGAQWHFISTLDDLAWLFNLRGADVSYNPVFVAHALIGLERVVAVRRRRQGAARAGRSARARRHPASNRMRRRPMRSPRCRAARTLLIDPRRITFGSLQSVPSTVKIVEAVNPSTFLKSRKTEADAEHVRATMEQDGAALAEFFAWFEGALGRETITELTIDERLTAARARRPDFVSLSFATIAGFNANGAMPHYRATAASHSMIEGNGLLLIDSGAQYLSGTTDITRVVPIGTLSDAQRRDFTIVLKGMMALSRAKFPRGIRSPMLDAIARAPIWEAGADYGHGTGHGVGYFLNVHEGPQIISHYAPAEPWTAMEEGMITSVEPGIYRPGKWGVRIENLVLNRAGGENRVRRFPQVRDADAVPDRHALLRPVAAARGRARMAERVSRDGAARIAPHVSGDAKAWLETRTQAI